MMQARDILLKANLKETWEYSKDVLSILQSSP